MKPLPLVASTFWWSALTILAFAYSTYVAVSLGEGITGIVVLTVLFFLTCSILWFLWSYWQGHDWTRTFVIVGLILKALYYFAGRFGHLAHSVQGVFSYVRIVDSVFSIYIFYWLFTKEARRYFTFQPRTN
jgi:hypothetical protein